MRDREIAVELENVSKYYRLYRQPIDRLKEALNPFRKIYHRKYYALEGVDLRIGEGEVVGIVGANGAGKSTLLKIVAGVLTPSEGRVRVSGKVNAILELGAGLKPEMTGRENIGLHLELNGIPERKRQEKMEEIVEFADIGAFVDQPVKTYSSGMKSRLGFSIATSMEPDILIVDEALSVGDTLFQRKSYARMEELFGKGGIVLFVSHDLQSIVQFCNRAILLHDRTLLLDGEPKIVVDRYQKLLFARAKSGKEGKSKKEGEERGECGAEKIDPSFFDVTLKPEPKILDNGGIEVLGCRIEDEKGFIVNRLKQKERYRIKVKFRVVESFRNLTFGFSIFNLKGLLVGGGRHFMYEFLEGDSSEREVEVVFENILQKGKFFLKIDFRFDHSEGVIFEGTDIYAFEVLESGVYHFLPVGSVVLPQAFRLHERKEGS
ncbi:ABC transporter ATP-binding protein [Hydrogenimonas sp.]